MSFRLRLTILYTGLLGAALLCFSLLLVGVLQWSFIQGVDSELEQVANRVASQFQLTGRLPRLDSLSDRSTFVLVRAVDGVIAQSNNFDGLFPLPARAREGEIVFSSETDAQGVHYRLVTVPVRSDAGVFYVQVAHALKLLELAQFRMRLPLVMGTLLFLVLAAVGAWWVAGRAVAPIERVARAAEAIGSSADLSMRVREEAADDEVGLLVRTFNGMLEQLQAVYARLAAAVDAQRRFVADASHELRTPLTIIRGNVDYMRKAKMLDDEALADVASEAERMSRLVEELLTTARADAGQAPVLEPIVLGPLVSEACRKAHALPREAEFRYELPEALDRITVMGNAEWLMRAFLILIDNAFKYTPSGLVTVRAGRQGDGVVIQVTDTGIGIPQEDLPFIFERFYRADRARGRGGAGLGLAIARWVAGTHGGKLTVDSHVGQGSTFSFWLPVHRV